MSDLSVMLISVILIGITFGMGLYTLLNIYDAIVSYKKPELFCAKCGRKLSKKRKICPKCKVRLK